MIAQQGTLEISRSRLRHNLDLIKGRLAAATQCCATLKANAYGHGAALMSELLIAAGIQWFAVYNLDEANAISSPSPGIAIPGLSPALPPNILVLAPFVITDSHFLNPEIIAARSPQIRLNIIDETSARHLSAALIAANTPHLLQIHIQIDTGLTRGGAAPQSLPHLADLIASLPNLHLEGIFAHFSHADIPGHPTILQQAAILHQLAGPLKRRYPHLLIHLQNSAAALSLNERNLDLARIGIALYGLQPSTATPIPELLPIARLTAPVLAIHETPADTGVGYGHTFITRRPSRIGIVPVGYGDGYPRALSNRCVAQIRGHHVPVVGRVSMDQITLDLTDVPAAEIGETVTVISNDPALPNSLDRMADATNTIGYEIATHLGSRLHRVIVD